MRQEFLINSFCMTQDADKIFFGSSDGLIKVMDIGTSYTLEKSVLAYKGLVRWFGTSKCGKYLATLGLMLDPNDKYIDTLKIWDLASNTSVSSLDLLYEKVFD